MEKVDLPTPPLHPRTAHLPPQGAPLSKTKSTASTALHRVASHLTTRDIVNPGPPPDGGLTAWVQVLCAWLVLMNTWGFVNAFGAFQTYYSSVLPENDSTISWIGSLQASLLFFVGMFSGRMLDAGYFRPTIIVGTVFQLLGIFGMSFSKNYWQFLLSQGVATGIGGGTIFCPVMGLVSTYFAKRRGLAVGLVTTGNSVGGLIYPVVVRQLLGPLGFGWTVRVLGFINVISLVVVIAFMKPRLPPRKSGPFVDRDAFRDVPYILFVFGICFIMLGCYFAFYYIASYARDSLDMPYTTSLNLVIILNGIGLPFRILPGYLADTYLGPLNTHVIFVIINAILFWTWLAVNSISSFYAYVSLYGLFVAGFQSLFPTAIACLSDDITKTGTRLGMALTVIGTAALVGGPIGGAILRASGSYVAPICWASACTGVGASLCVSARGWKHGWSLKKKC